MTTSCYVQSLRPDVPALTRLEAITHLVALMIVTLTSMHNINMISHHILLKWNLPFLVWVGLNIASGVIYNSNLSRNNQHPIHCNGYFWCLFRTKTIVAFGDIGCHGQWFNAFLVDTGHWDTILTLTIFVCQHCFHNKCHSQTGILAGFLHPNSYDTLSM